MSARSRARLPRGRALALGALALLCGCHGAVEDATPRAPTAPVRLATIDRGDVEARLETFGTLELDRARTHTISAVRAGEVAEVRAVAGEEVRRGEALLVVRALPAGSLGMQQAQLDETFARSALERVRRMAALHLATNQELDAARKQLEASRAALAGLGGDGTGPQSVATPGDGIVSELLVSEGSIVQPGQELLRIAPVGTIAARVGFELEDLPSLGEDRPVRIEPAFPAPGDAPITATLGRMHRVADPTTQLVDALIRIDAPPAWAVAGARVRVEVVLQSAPDAVRIPTAALARRAGELGAWIAEDGRARFGTLVLGAQNDAWSEVRSGLAPGQRVVIAGSTTLEDGMSVRETP